jgi:hypothetical protein
MSTAQNPLKWLLAELPAEIDPAPLAALMERYQANKRAYEQQIKIRAIERTIKGIQFRNNPNDAAKLARWHAKLAKLSEETQ